MSRDKIWYICRALDLVRRITPSDDPSNPRKKGVVKPSFEPTGMVEYLPHRDRGDAWLGYVLPNGCSGQRPLTGGLLEEDLARLAEESASALAGGSPGGMESWGPLYSALGFQGQFHRLKEGEDRFLVLRRLVKQDRGDLHHRVRFVEDFLAPTARYVARARDIERCVATEIGAGAADQGSVSTGILGRITAASQRPLLVVAMPDGQSCVIPWFDLAVHGPELTRSLVTRSQGREDGISWHDPFRALGLAHRIADLDQGSNGYTMLRDLVASGKLDAHFVEDLLAV